MIDTTAFKEYARDVINWIAEYYENIEDYPVKSPAKPREIFNQ